MVSANRVQISYVQETTPGTTPTTPRMKTARITGETLTFEHIFADSDELRSDRMNIDPILQMVASSGAVNIEFSYPVPDTYISDSIKCALYNEWVNTPQRDNDGTADSVVTDIGTVANTVTFTTGAAFVIGHLVKTSGFTTSANNTIAKVTTGGATSLVATAGGYVAEAAPPGTARVKVVGAQGAAADITATATGLGSTVLDFTTLGIRVGGWIKIGGTAAGDKFATAVLNDYARVIAITATALTLDNLPVGWTTDAGTGKTIKIWFGDQIKNGVTEYSQTIEKGFLGQTVPSYIVGTGEHISQWTLQFSNRSKITGSFTYMGMGGSLSTTTLDALVDDPTTNPIMASHANVGRVGAAGATVTAPNWGRSFSFTVNNNSETIEAFDQTSPVGVVEGEATVTGEAEFYFGSAALLTAFYAGTPTSLNARVQKNSQAVVFQFPRMTYNGGGNPQATAKNTQVMASFNWKASKDTLTSAHIVVDRLEYIE